MRSGPTRYTSRCSCVIRRDQRFALRCRMGSGFPSPANGSRVTASTSARTFSATLRSCDTHQRRSSRNSSWKTVARDRTSPRSDARVRPQGLRGLRGSASIEGPLEGLEEPPRVPGRAEEMSRLLEAPQLVGGKECHVGPAPA